MAEWQTRQLEGLVGATPWRFKSSWPHWYNNFLELLFLRGSFFSTFLSDFLIFYRIFFRLVIIFIHCQSAPAFLYIFHTHTSLYQSFFFLCIFAGNFYKDILCSFVFQIHFEGFLHSGRRLFSPIIL